VFGFDLSKKKKNAFQPPLFGAAWLSRRRMTLPNSISCKSTFMPARRSWSVPTRDSVRIPPSPVGARMTIFSPL
jgi:hypothetical protein